MLFIFILAANLRSTNASFSASVGLLKNMNTVQDEVGEETSDPFMPMVKVGYTSLESYLGFRLSPHFFWSMSSKESNDSYGGDYSVRIYGFLYDVIYPINTNMGLRFGLGNVIKSIAGEGGTVTIPNGNETATAYRPDEKSTSYSGTMNLGFDYTMPTTLLGLTNTGLRAEYLLMSPLRSRRTGYLMLSLQGYF